MCIYIYISPCPWVLLRAGTAVVPQVRVCGGSYHMCTSCKFPGNFQHDGGVTDPESHTITVGTVGTVATVVVAVQSVVAL